LAVATVGLLSGSARQFGVRSQTIVASFHVGAETWMRKKKTSTAGTLEKCDKDLGQSNTQELTR
jgi:hypothetical protein